MRYTKKSIKFVNTYEWNSKLPTKTFVQLGMNKLGQLEDIEKEIGINLITLFKALKNGVYMSTKHFDIVYCKCPKIVHYKIGWKILIYDSILSLTTYGKIWALTEKQLKALNDYKKIQ